MSEEMNQERPGERELRLIAQTFKSVVEMLVNLSNNMLQAYDLHFGNIAFENKSTEGSTKLKGLKLIVWEGNGMANAQQTERGRMRHAFDAVNVQPAARLALAFHLSSISPFLI